MIPNAAIMVPNGGVSSGGGGGGNTGRTILTSNTNFYVTISGSDSSPGSFSQPWRTLQHAALFIANNLDFGGHVVTVNIGAGTFVGFGFATCVGGGALQFVGAGAALTTIQAGPNDGFFNFGECVTLSVNGYDYTLFGLDGVTLSNPTHNIGLAIYAPSVGNLGLNFLGGGVGVTLATFNGYQTFAPCTIFQGPITIPAGTYNIIFFLSLYGNTQAFSPVTLVGTINTNSLIQCEEYSFFQDFFGGGSGFVGALASGNMFVGEWYSNCNLASIHFPSGSNSIHCDSTSTFGPPFFYTQPAFTGIGISSMAAGQWGYFKDGGQATGFGNFLATDDAGTIANIGKIGVFTVATLPAGKSQGTEAWVSDGNAPVFGAIAVGGGAVFTPVYFDLTNWRFG